MKGLQGYLGPYKILGHVASGPTSEVYAVAGDTLPDAHEVYALKVRGASELVDGVAQRINADAKATSLLRNPHLARIHDAFAYDGRLHYVTDFVAGETLGDMLVACGGKFPPLVAVVIAIELANTLHEVHNQGDSMGRPLVHGDVCPQNVMLTHQGRVVLLDLGVALADSRLRHDARSVIGHAGYAAPERLQSPSEVDARSDVYSVGLVLWEMLVGRPAIRGSSEAEIASRAMKPKIPLLSTQAKVSAALEAIVEEAIRPARSARCPTARHLANALSELKSARLATWDRRVEIEKLVLQHFGHRARAQRTLLDRWRVVVADPKKLPALAHIPIRMPRSTSGPATPRAASAPPAVPPPVPPLTPPAGHVAPLAEPVPIPIPIPLEIQATDDLARPQTADLPPVAPRPMSFVVGLCFCVAGACGLIASSLFWPSFAQRWALAVAEILARLFSRIVS